MTTKEQLIDLLLEHGFECGKSVNTKDWYAKRVHEIRLNENGFTHMRHKAGKFIPEYYPNTSLRQLELVIFDNLLNKVGTRRNHAGFAMPISKSVSTVIPKRRAKMVEGFERITV